VEFLVVRVPGGLGAQDRDGDVGEAVPVGVERMGALVEERVTSDVRHLAGHVIELGVEGSGQRIDRKQVHATVAHERRPGGEAVERPLQALARRP
jgi:hypothetical protein